MIARLADTGPDVLRLLGRLHPAVVHFPIGLITVAAILESLQIVRKKPEMSPATPYCLVLGAGFALLAALFGWLLEDFDKGGSGGALVDLHKWLGIAATAVAILAVLLLRKAMNSPNALLALRTVIFSGAALVGATGYLGGDLVFGQNHLFKGLFKGLFASAAPQSGNGHAGNGYGGNGHGANGHGANGYGANGYGANGDGDDHVDFAKDVFPILEANCLRCHHEEQKIRGNLDMKTKADAMKGGKKGKCIVPGQPHQSMFYSLLIEPDPLIRMPPPKEAPLTREQIETIRRWIEQGAEWPG